MDLFDKFAGISELHSSLQGVGGDPFHARMDQILSSTEAVIRGRNVILAGTNNYLGLTFDPDCIDAACTAIQSQGTGTTGSRVLNGTYNTHQELENALADFYNCKMAIVFTTGYQANLGALSGLAGADDYVIIDADSHASIYDGCRLSAATTIRFRHNNPEDLDKRLSRLDGDGGNKIVVAEGIYSMLGDRAPLKEFAEVTRKHGVYFMVDEAHSLGVLGENGRGVSEEAGIEDDVDFIVGTFSKSLGAIGGFLASRHEKCEYLRFSSHPYMYTASLSPANVSSTLAALEKLRAGSDLRARIRENAATLYEDFTAAGFTVGEKNSPVVAVILSSPEEAVHMWNRLIELGVYVNAAIPPGTPNGLSLLRCSVSAAHSPEQIKKIGEAFVTAAAQVRESVSGAA